MSSQLDCAGIEGAGIRGVNSYSYLEGFCLASSRPFDKDSAWRIAFGD